MRIAGRKWLVELLGADYFQEVSVVDLSRMQVIELTPLAKLTSLRDIHLDNTQVSDLTPLATLRHTWFRVNLIGEVVSCSLRTRSRSDNSRDSAAQPSAQRRACPARASETP
jgi:hypothetical protein